MSPKDKEKDSKGGQNPSTMKQDKTIQNKDEIVINKADFITVNAGKFRVHYQMGQVLGQGAFGEVRKCMGRAGK